jgi:hypothetical protein
MLISCVNNVVKGFRTVKLSPVNAHYTTLAKLLDIHKSKTIVTDNRIAKTERLQKLETDIMASPKIQEAFQSLSLQSVITRLFAVNKEYVLLFQEYIVEKSAEERIDISALRQKCTQALAAHFNAIQYCSTVSEDNDYQSLSKELGEIHVYCNQQLKVRATRRKNGKKTSQEPPIELPDNKSVND